MHSALGGLRSLAGAVQLIPEQGVCFGMLIDCGVFLHSTWLLRLVIHCCYQRPFQEVNIPMNRALLPNCKIELTDCLFLNLKKTELLKQFYDKLILPEMPGGIIDQFFF